MPAASTMNSEESEFVLDSGATMHMVRKKDLNSAELETVRAFFLSDDGRNSQRRGPNKRRGNSVCQRSGFNRGSNASKIHRPFSHSENSSKITDILTIRPVVRIHNSSKMADAMRISKNPMTVITANSEVLTKEEATVYVKEYDLFVTVMHLAELLLPSVHGFQLRPSLPNRPMSATNMSPFHIPPACDTKPMNIPG